MAYTFSLLKNNYQQLFDTCRIKENLYADVDACINKMVAAKSRYDIVAARTGIPWYFIGIVHNMECSGSFTSHLHNGDPLTARTVQVPKGLPKKGDPPFTWEDSAEDSLRYKALDKWTDWSIPGMLYQLERYNGFGYRPKQINTPYLWSGSNQYTKGKYTADGKFNSDAVSKQIGAAVLLRRLSERGLTQWQETDLLSQVKKLGATVTYNPNNYSAAAEQLQALLNKLGFHLREDGHAGDFTSDAYKNITGSYLTGDKRNL
jgi:lysozyme family protein